jgi:hypothetical protein
MPPPPASNPTAPFLPDSSLPLLLLLLLLLVVVPAGSAVRVQLVHGVPCTPHCTGQGGARMLQGAVKRKGGDGGMQDTMAAW